MPASRFERFLPVSGFIAAVLFALPMFLTGSLPTASDDPAKMVRWFEDHQNAASVAGLSLAYFAVFMVFFTVGLRQALRSGEPGESTYSSAAFAGGLLVAFTQLLSAAGLMGAATAADKGQRAAVTTMGFADEFGWIPWAAGSAVLLIGAGLGGMRTAVLPKWLGVVTAILGVLCLTGPTGIGVFMLTPLWLIAVSVVLLRRVRAGNGAPVPPTGVVSAAG
ncbi:hypothetical protein AB0M28_18040 [Streptomyces sp. NPDC051940]|uniref:hypothetical protein n=1 Tax=Streptomyces sp. NPDC051940 TaxID=3155675 RepID=UPI0034270CC8